MPPAAKRLTPLDVFTALQPLLPPTTPAPQAAPLCDWCQGPTVWTTGNKTRCTRCGYVPS